jgi:hypothetical protein
VFCVAYDPLARGRELFAGFAVINAALLHPFQTYLREAFSTRIMDLKNSDPSDEPSQASATVAAQPADTTETSLERVFAIGQPVFLDADPGHPDFRKLLWVSERRQNVGMSDQYWVYRLVDQQNLEYPTNKFIGGRSLVPDYGRDWWSNPLSGADHPGPKFQQGDLVLVYDLESKNYSPMIVLEVYYSQDRWRYKVQDRTKQGHEWVVRDTKMELDTTAMNLRTLQQNHSSFC